MKFPDKFKHKTTTTNKLREDIVKESLRFNEANYLEIGFSWGFTILGLSENFKNLYGTDIDPNRLKESTKLMNDNNITNVHLSLQTSDKITKMDYHVVLIDADHSYDAVKNDCFNILKINTMDNFTIFFHDYGLVDAGVKKFIDETFLDDEKIVVGELTNWNPLGGPTNDCEGIKIHITPEIKNRVLNAVTEK